MKTARLTKIEGIGLALVVSGSVLLGLSYYLYQIDFQFDEKILETPTNPDYMGPIHLPPILLSSTCSY
ncbi:MAG: hypothetical protein KGH88_08625 [Thaumarchaeota archaeon]|nr:hypothetical protein [Nitrososphaerota archaeon]